MPSTSTVIEVSTDLSADAISQRVAEVEDFDRFAAFKFALRSEQHALEVANADGVVVVSPDGVYLGYVEDQDDSHYYVNLR